jgi:hypothetical protein
MAMCQPHAPAVTLLLRNILYFYQSRGGRGGWDMWHEWGRKGTCIGYWQDSQRERAHQEDRDVGG